MVVQSKQLRANSAMVHSGLSWDQVELKCCEECGKSQSPVRAVFVWNLMAVKHCLCMSTYPPTHTGVSCSQGVCTGKERRRNFYSTSGLTVPGWVRYTVKSDKVLHTVINYKSEMKSPTHGFACWTHHRGRARAMTRAASAQELTLTWALQNTTSWNNGLIWCIKYKNPTHFCPIYCDWH